MQNEIDIREEEMKIEIFKITEEDVTIRTTIIPHEKKTLSKNKVQKKLLKKQRK